MKRMIRLAVLLAALSLLSVGFAQGPARQPRGQFGAGQFGGGAQLLGLLRMPDVQAELKLTEAQKSKLEALNVRPQAGAGPPTQEERQARAAQIEKDIQGVLDKAQFERLKQLSLQLRGAEALAYDKDLQKALGLSEDQVKKISDTVAQVRQSHMQAFRGGGGEPPDREQIAARMQEMRKEMTTKVEALLTAEQKAKFQAMKGKPFQFANPMGFGPRGRQPGGRGEPGGGPGGPPGRGDGGL